MLSPSSVKGELTPVVEGTASEAIYMKVSSHEADAS